MRRDQDQSIEQWRKKYYDSLEELEDKEKQWSETESLLRVLVSRLTLIAETEDKNLNRQLDELRQSIREEISSHHLQRSIEKISSNINKLDTSRKNRLDPYAPVKLILDRLSVPDQLRKQERHLRKHIDVAGAEDINQVVQNLVELIGYINEFSQPEKTHAAPLVEKEKKEVMPPQQETVSEEDKSKGFLSGLFGKKSTEIKMESQDEISVPQKSGQEAAINKLEETIQQVNSDASIDVRTACETLINLIEHFSLPNDLAVEANLIKGKLETCTSREELISLVESLAALVSEVHARVDQERSELEDFLKQLTDRLHEIDTDIRENAKINEQSHKKNNAFGMTMQGEVSEIENSVDKAPDLESLKRVIQSRVVILRNHMDTYIESEQVRHEQSSKLIERLQNRVQTMESETETLKQEVRKKQEQATRDALTGVANRLAYNERIASEIARNRRYQSPLTILVWDIDKFKSINDNYGHAAGDKVLVAIARVLSSNIRETDFIARFGGEEFVILMPETTLNDAEQVANKLRETIEACNFHFREKRVVITASCGIAEIKHNETEDTLFERADNALYKAKESGRNRCQCAQ